MISFAVARATAQQHQPPSETVLSHPAHWDEYKVECFDRAIAAANLGTVRRCTDAEAAVAMYAARESLGSGERVVVYDLGGGSCEVALLEKTSSGARVLGASECVDHPSGADFDEAIFRLVLSNLGGKGRQLEADDPDSRRRLAEVKRACTQAKEALSTAAEAEVPIALPGNSTTVRLGRQEFVSLVRPGLRESVAMTARVIHGAGLQASDLAAIILVGGCCRMPVVAELLQREFEAPIGLGTHPEYDVAIGALLTSQPGTPLAASVAVAAIGEPIVGETAQAVAESPPAAQATSPEAMSPAAEAPPAAKKPAGPETTPAEETISPEPAPTSEEKSLDAEQLAAAQPQVDEAAESATADATVISEATLIRPPVATSEDDLPTDQLPQPIATTPASAADHSPVPNPQAPGQIPEETMPDHLIFDYFTSAEFEAAETTPGQAAYAAAPSPPLPPWAQASAPVSAPGSGAAGSSPPPPAYGAQMASGSYPQGPRPPGSPPPRPGSAPSPGQYPPGQYPPGQYPPGQYPPGQYPPGPRGPGSPGLPPGPPTQQQYGARGPGGPGGYPPGPGGEGSGPFGSRGKLILIIAGAVVLVGAAVVAGVLISRSGQPSSTASPSVFFPTPSSQPASVTPSASPSVSSSASASGSASSTPTSSPAQKLPSAAAIPQSEVIIPMRFDSGPDRPLYLVDTEGKAKQVELPTPDGGNSNPVMQASRNTIVYANSGVLRVMASDGSGDRKLFNRDPAGCDNVAHASWSLTDSNVILLTCQLSKGKFGLLVVGLDGRLIRRLDAGKKMIGDAGISPDGQTVLYWASDNTGQDGGALYTLPIIGTGEPKPLTNSAAGVDADPAWSPDGTQIAFRRRLPSGNQDVFVMNADGTGLRPVATTPAADFKPVWSPDGKNLLIISNRKSAFGGPGSTFDLWVTRVTDGEVLTNLDLKARQITRPFWTQR
jgi:molecular chaperone DnaK